MTPLAHKVAKELTLPKARRTFENGPGPNVLGLMNDLHCFEVTEVYNLALDLALNVEKVSGSPLTSFLPAPRTWIEFLWPGSPQSRVGYLLVGNDPAFYSDPAEADKMAQYPSLASACMVADIPTDKFFGVVNDMIPFDLRYGPYIPRDTGDHELVTWEDRKVEGYVASENLIPAFLLLINSPKVIGRRQHMPHRGLQKRLAAARGMTGKFPLHAWTEIKLEVTTPRDASGDPVAEGHLTGQRALHFCRSHVRVRLGRLEIVRSHWRGDPSLGLKQARYKVTA